MKDKVDLKKLSLREFMEYTRNLPIREGGLGIFIEKLVMEIEYLHKMVDGIHKHITRKPYD